jgi:8-amino-7-oxononanoate synthase
LYDSLKDLGFRLGPEPSPIIAIRFGGGEEAIACWNSLFQQGVYVNMILPPAAPDGGSLLRCSESAAHTPDQIDRISKAFTSSEATFSV